MAVMWDNDLPVIAYNFAKKKKKKKDKIMSFHIFILKTKLTCK